MPDDDLRVTFDDVAAQYADVRPGYPDELFDALVAVTGIGPESALLEIGPGTGQATVPMAARGFAITAVELGGAMARLARGAPRRVPDGPGWCRRPSRTLTCRCTPSTWCTPRRPCTGCRRPSAGGDRTTCCARAAYLGVIYSEHVSDESGDAFFAASQDIYRTATEQPHPRANAHGASPDDEPRLPLVSDLQPEHLDLDLFDPVASASSRCVIRYSAERFAALVDTFSTTRALPPTERAERLDRLAGLIDQDFGGYLDKQFAMTLTIARAR